MDKKSKTIIYLNINIMKKSKEHFKRILKAIAEANSAYDLLKVSEEFLHTSNNFNKEIIPYHQDQLCGAIWLRQMQIEKLRQKKIDHEKKSN